jgi:thiosulfate/3-mercaptopyruvate sulfurtransferase
MTITRTPLCTIAELAAELADGHPVTLLDVRWTLTGGPQHDAYLAGHLPGARFVDLDRELADPPGERGRHPLPDQDRFGAAMRAHGVRADRPVVVYDAADGIQAARCWWLLRHAGHTDVRLLDGGLAAWTAAGQPVRAGEPGHDDEPAGDFVPAYGAMPVLDAQAAAALARDGVLLDVRTPERFRGEVEPIDPVAGHIPGARNAPAADGMTPDGRLRTPDELRQRYAALGARDGVPVGAYCGSGVTAAHEVLALEVAGLRGAMYPGSWSEWVADPSRPVARD